MQIGSLEHIFWKKVNDMPYKSAKQRKYFHANIKKIGKKVVEEFDEEERKKSKKKKRSSK